MSAPPSQTHVTGIAPLPRQLHGDKGVVGWEGKNPDVAKGLWTKATGCPISHFNSKTAGPHGPILLEDHELLEKLQHFTREPTPPRNVHPLGTGAYGSLTITQNNSKYTKGKIFSQVGKTIPLFARFSGTFLLQGEAETNRDIRGFAMKMYTEEGNWDLMTVNTPVFAVRDAKVGPDNVHAFKRDPRTNEWNTHTIWDYTVNHPESIHQALMIYTDRVGTPCSFRCMETYGINTYSFYNDKGERFWIKFHMLSEQGAGGLTQTTAKLIAGEDPDFLSRDLREAIEEKRYPSWKLCFQVMPEQEGYKHTWAFDCTKVWPHAEYPLQEIGRVVIDGLPINYHSEVEQVAFSPANVIPGIGFSPDKLLQGRVMIYDDAQFHRLGPNFKQIPINRPHVEPHTPYNGGQHNHEIRDKFPGSHPSNYGKYQIDNNSEPPLMCDGPAAYYEYDGAGSDADYYEQPRAFYHNVLAAEERINLISNLGNSLSRVYDAQLINQVLTHLGKVDEQLPKQVDEVRKKILAMQGPQEESYKVWNEVRKVLKALPSKQ